MLQNVDPTWLYIVTTLVAVVWGFFYMRTRYRSAHEKFDSERADLHERRRQREAKKLELDAELKEIEANLKGKPVPKELRGPAPVLDFKKSDKPVTLEEALQGTKSGLMGRISSLFSSGRAFSSEDLEAIEEILYTSDLGPRTVQKLITAVTDKVEAAESKNAETVRVALRDEMIQILEKSRSEPLSRHFSADFKPPHQPEVWMVVGVNGAGKTTTIGKLANHLAQAGKTVLVAAGDTFRAAAGEQLKVWTERAKVEIFAPEGVESPSAVAFDACKMAQQKGYDYLIIDTAGRLHTQKNLMDELKKVKRVIDKSQTGAPHETLLVLDANSGQNALIQAREFHSALSVTGVVLTKLDGTAKGGMAVGVVEELEIPIQLIGIGEGKDDLRPFQAKEFVNAIV